MMRRELNDTWAAWNSTFVEPEPEDEDDDFIDDVELPPGTHRLRLERSGMFDLEVEGDQHCGVTDDGFVECRYDVRIECETDSLDGQGFLVEQLGIHDFFQELPPTTLSCEKLVVWCAKKLHEKIRDENVNCKVQKMSVTIAPMGADGQASMTFEWEPDAELEPDL